MCNSMGACACMCDNLAGFKEVPVMLRPGKCCVRAWSGLSVCAPCAPNAAYELVACRTRAVRASPMPRPAVGEPGLVVAPSMQTTKRKVANNYNFTNEKCHNSPGRRNHNAYTCRKEQMTS